MGDADLVEPRGDPGGAAAPAWQRAQGFSGTGMR